MKRCTAAVLLMLTTMLLSTACFPLLGGGASGVDPDTVDTSMTIRRSQDVDVTVNGSNVSWYEDDSGWMVYRRVSSGWINAEVQGAAVDAEVEYTVRLAYHSIDSVTEDGRFEDGLQLRLYKSDVTITIESIGKQLE